LSALFDMTPTETEAPVPVANETDASSTEASSAEVPDPSAASPADGPVAAPPARPEMNPADCVQQLKQRWPAVFSGSPKPLKLRIHVDIQERAPGVFPRQALTFFFRRYTSTTSYLLAMAKGTQRFDLDGQPSGEVTDENRKVASDELARRGANQEARRALEAQQRRNRAGLLHDYERTTLTRANFCALKGVAVEELDGLLAIAREEAAQQPPQREHDSRGHRPPHRPPRSDGGGNGGGHESSRRDGPRDGRGPGRQGARNETRNDGAQPPRGPHNEGRRR
jgi:hypothetical protein